MNFNIQDIHFTTEMVGHFSIEIGTTVIDFLPKREFRKWQYGGSVEGDTDTTLSCFGLGPLLLVSTTKEKYDRSN